MTTPREPGELRAETSVDIPEVLREALYRGDFTIDGSSIIELLSVDPNPEGSRQHSVILRVRTADGRTRSLLAKSGKTEERTDVGHPWGIDQEVAAYTGPLNSLETYRSPFIGAVDDGHGRIWLLLKWLDQAVPLAQGPHPQSIHHVAHWLGTFHRESITWITAEPSSGDLVPYGDVINAWASATVRELEPYVASGSDLARILADLSHALSGLAAAEDTVVHGDLYPPNVLLKGPDVVPIDWEWIGIGPGEIDVAALTDGWEDDDVSTSVHLYWQARRPGYVPDASDVRRLWAARLFLVARWLGGHVSESNPPPQYWLEQLELCYRRALEPLP